MRQQGHAHTDFLTWNAYPNKSTGTSIGCDWIYGPLSVDLEMYVVVCQCIHLS